MEAIIPYLNFNGNADEALSLYNKGEGGTVTMPVQDTFWGARFGMTKDKFGVHWMFNYDYPKK